MTEKMVFYFTQAFEDVVNIAFCERLLLLFLVLTHF